MWCKSHTSPGAYWRARGIDSTHRRCLSCRCKRFKISLEVAALDVVAPFMVALNGDAIVAAPMMADESREQMVVRAQPRESVNVLPPAPAALPHGAGC
jgi:hypothetical protein